jgi:5-methylcytosine-specific restriction enzyme subunit McrC
MSVEAQDTVKNEHINEHSIPIQNIYYMLSYAFNNLKINNDIVTDCEDFKNIYDLFARLMIEGVNKLIKGGFYKEYILENDDTSSIRGKINLERSIKRQTFLYQKLNCEFDEFSEDILFNRILKTTIYNLIKAKDLDGNLVLNGDLAKNLKKLRPFFDNVPIIDLNKYTFKSFMWHRNNQHYKLIINICELIFKLQLPDESKYGETIFKDFIETYKNEMANLFEKFVLNYYKKEFEELNPKSPKIDWDLDDNSKEKYERKFLPEMRTDIVLTNLDSFKRIIIDTKFYQEILSQNEKLKNSGHIYQIYAYVNNCKFNGEIIGILLYASLGENMDYHYKIGSHEILIKTLDLNQNWDEIDKRLKEIANIF